MARDYDYKELFQRYLWDQDAIMQWWAEASLSEIPRRLHRGRQRKTESIREWKERGYQILSTHPPKRPSSMKKLYAHIDRDSETLDNLRAIYELSDEEIARFGYLYPRNSSLDSYETETENRQRQTSRYEADGLETLRYQMGQWILTTLIFKRSEAVCNLDCFNCGSAMLLHCAAQNLGVVEADIRVLGTEVFSIRDQLTFRSE